MCLKHTKCYCFSQEVIFHVHLCLTGQGNFLYFHHFIFRNRNFAKTLLVTSQECIRELLCSQTNKTIVESSVWHLFYLGYGFCWELPFILLPVIVTCFCIWAHCNHCILELVISSSSQSVLNLFILTFYTWDLCRIFSKQRKVMWALSPSGLFIWSREIQTIDSLDFFFFYFSFFKFIF